MPEFLTLLDDLDTAVKQLRLSFDKYQSRTAWYEIRDTKTISMAIHHLMDQSMAVHQLLDTFANRGKDLESCFKRIGSLMNSLDMFIERHSDDFIQWLELRGNGFLLHQTPLDIAETFQSRLADYGCQCIYTSATLTVKANFDHFANQMGLMHVKQKSWSSPFDYQRQAMLYLPTGLPDPRVPGYTEQVVDMAIPVLKFTRGRAFFLFTSHRALQIAAGFIRGKIDYPVLVQGEAPRTELLETFRSTPHSVLLGTQSFWEGVDVKGQGLSCVIIDKLPFATPDDPVLKARMKKLEEQGKNPFIDYQLPEAVITLKQGVGRLIRDSDDYGVLMICDPRLLTKPYGKIFLNSLPVMEIKTNINDVKVFFQTHETGV